MRILDGKSNRFCTINNIIWRFNIINYIILQFYLIHDIWKLSVPTNGIRLEKLICYL